MEENYNHILNKLNENNIKSKENAKSVVEVDSGSLMAYDPRPIDTQLLENDTYIKNLCTMSTQILIENLFNLSIERVQEVYVAKLPKPSTIFPREKQVPRQKPLTKWEQYAKMKGISNKKKSRKVFDEASGEWKPAWGYKRKDDSTKQWLIEIKKNQDPNQDFFSKKTEEKNERVAKNELQRLRNIARANKKKVPGVGLTPTVDSTKPDKFQIKRALNLAKKSDASMAKFSTKLENEDNVTRGLKKKRKYESNFKNIQDEKQKQLKIFDKLTDDKEKPNKQKIKSGKAANKLINEENKNWALNKKQVKKSSKGGRVNKHISYKKKR